MAFWGCPDLDAQKNIDGFLFERYSLSIRLSTYTLMKELKRH